MLGHYLKSVAVFLVEIALVWLFFYTVIDISALNDDPSFITFLIAMASLTIILMKQRLSAILYKKIKPKKITATSDRALKRGFKVCLPLGLVLGLMSLLLNFITLTDAVLVVSIVFIVVYSLYMYKIVPNKLKIKS